MSHFVSVLVVCDENMVPHYSHPGDAGADLRSSVDVIVPAQCRVLVATGVSLALPDGYVGLVHPRSGLAINHGITVLNSPGTIDSSYRGEVKVALYNTSTEAYEVRTGDRIAQLVIQEVARAEFVLVDRLPDSHRGAAGFGSSGKV
jgi:dUTP pyrophosphatase